MNMMYYSISFETISIILKWHFFFIGTINVYYKPSLQNCVLYHVRAYVEQYKGKQQGK